jgi:glycosyltransferase involved in cell wall biosynthesis
MKKIIFVLPEYYSDDTTHYNHIVDLIKEASMKMEILVFVERGNVLGNLGSNTKVYRQFFTLPIINLIERIIFFIYTRIKGYKDVYVHYSYWSAILSCLVLRPLGGSVYFWHCETFENYQALLTRNLAGFRRRIFDHWPLLITLRLVSYLVTGSRGIGKYYACTFDTNPQKIKILPNSIKLERFNKTKTNDQEVLKKRLKIAAGDRVILFIHRLVARKGTDNLSCLVETVSKYIKNAKFIIIGNGPDEKKLRDKFEEKRFKKKVRMIGSVPNSEVSKYFSIADIFILPSKQEGFPRVLLESMAIGVPFVSFDVGSVSEVTTNIQKRYIVRPNDIESFSNNVIKLLNNQNERQLLIRNGLQHVKKFNLKKTARIFQRLFV